MLEWLGVKSQAESGEAEASRQLEAEEAAAQAVVEVEELHRTEAGLLHLQRPSSVHCCNLVHSKD